MKLTPEQEAECRAAWGKRSWPISFIDWRAGFAAGLAAREPKPNTEGAAQSQEPVAVFSQGYSRGSKWVRIDQPATTKEGEKL